MNFTLILIGLVLAKLYLALINLSSSLTEISLAHLPVVSRDVFDPKKGEKLFKYYAISNMG